MSYGFWNLNPMEHSETSWSLSILKIKVDAVLYSIQHVTPFCIPLMHLFSPILTPNTGFWHFEMF